MRHQGKRSALSLPRRRSYGADGCDACKRPNIGLIGIGNEGFIVYALDFRNVFPVPVTVGLSSSDWEDVTPLADSFAEWLEGTLP